MPNARLVRFSMTLSAGSYPRRLQHGWAADYQTRQKPDRMCMASMTSCHSIEVDSRSRHRWAPGIRLTFCGQSEEHSATPLWCSSARPGGRGQPKRVTTRPHLLRTFGPCGAVFDSPLRRVWIATRAAVDMVTQHPCCPCRLAQGALPCSRLQQRNFPSGGT